MNVIVIGAGIFGIAAALELRRRNHVVTLVEQGKIPNPLASSTDVSKVIRRTMYPNETHIELVTRAAEQWQKWHDQISQSIYFQTGKLIVVRDLDSNHEALAGWETLNRLNKGVTELTTKETRKKFPQFEVSDKDHLFYDPWAGYLRSGQALTDLVQLAREDGVVVRENLLVQGVEDTVDSATVVCESDVFSCDRVVVSAGPWVASLLPIMKQQVRITRQQMAFFTPQNPALFDRAHFPVWSILSPGNSWYGFPYLHEGYVKIAEDSKLDTTIPDVEREPTVEFLKWAQEFVAERIPSLSSGKLVGGRSCLYTNMVNMTDEEFVIDWVPGCDRLLIAGCGCGHGFKFGGALGPLIADALEDKENRLGDLFRIGNRFKPESS